MCVRVCVCVCVCAFNNWFMYIFMRMHENISTNQLCVKMYVLLCVIGIVFHSVCAHTRARERARTCVCVCVCVCVCTRMRVCTCLKAHFFILPFKRHMCLKKSTKSPYAPMIKRKTPSHYFFFLKNNITYLCRVKTFKDKIEILPRGKYQSSDHSMNYFHK